jgi:hypothetical protein
MAEFATIRSRLATSGLTMQSAEWLLKAMSPATPTGAACSIPDTSSVPVATPEYVVSTTLSAPSGAGVGSWDLIVVTLPTYPVLGYAYAQAAGFNFAATSWATGGGVFNSILAEPFAASISSTNAVISNVLGTAVLTNTSLITYEPSTLPLKWRRAYSSLTAYMTASDLYNGGTVTSVQVPSRVATYIPGEYVSVGAAPALWQMALVEVPLSEQAMTSMSPKVRIAPANTGLYCPGYNTGPEFKWAEPAFTPAVSLDSSFAANKTVYYPQNGLVGGTYASASVPTILSPTDPTVGSVRDEANFVNMLIGNSATAYSVGMDSTMCGVHIFRGLNNPATITLKFVVGLEISPAPESPIRQFIVPDMGYEPRAMQLYWDLVRDMPHVYPASANFLGAVLSSLKGLLPSLLPSLASGARAALDYFVPPTVVRRVPIPNAIEVRSSQPELSGRRAKVLQPALRRRSASAASTASRVSRVSGRRAVRVAAPKRAPRRGRAR